MVTLEEILTGPEGLLPHLSNTVGGTFERWQIRPWNFNAIGTPGSMSDGILITDDQTMVYKSHARVEQDVIIGFMISVESTNDKVAGAALRDALNQEIHCWSYCSELVDEINEISGGITKPKQSPSIPTSKPGAWAIVVWRMFTICYDTN